jgi:alpha-L-arabinofuranosidase
MRNPDTSFYVRLPIAWHMGAGRFIDSLFEEDTPLSDKSGSAKRYDGDRNLHVPILRWPGGKFVSNSNWNDGVGPRDRRSHRLEMAWGGSIEADSDARLMQKAGERRNALAVFPISA